MDLSNWGELGVYGTGLNYLNNQFGRLDDKLFDTGGTFDTAQQRMQDMGDFTPWGVRSRMGPAGYNPNNGNLNFNLSDKQSGAANQLYNQSLDLMAAPMQDRGARESEIYDRIRAMQMPGEQRQQAQLDNQTLNRGRSGMFTNLAGGTPEQLAMSKAQAEAQNSAAYSAMGQAEQEMMNQYNMGRTMFQDQYMPQNEQMKMMQMAMNNAQLQQHGDLQRTGMWNQLDMGEAATRANMFNVQGNFLSNMMQTLAPAVGGATNDIGGWFTGEDGSFKWPWE